MSGPVREEIRVLHVEDNAEVRELTKTLLEREDDRFSVTTAASAENGLVRVEEDRPDCIVSDYNMPATDGIELLRTVREDYPDLPFILYTGRGSEEVASEAISAGVTDYLQKEGGTSQYTVLANRIENAVEAERSSRRAEQRRHRLEQILKTVPACVVQLDAEGRFVFANRRAEAVLGLETDELTDRTYADPEWDIRDLDGNPLPEGELPFRRVIDTGEPVYGAKHSIKWPDGTRKILLVNGAPLFDEEGAVESVVFSLSDISSKRNQQRELERTRRRLELALEVTDTGVWEWDLETDDVVWNDTLERAMGLEPGEFEGTFDAFADRVHPDDIDRVNEQLEHAVETESLYQTEFRMRTGDGSIQWGEVRGQIVQDRDGKRMVGVYHDITEREEREAELQSVKLQYQTLVENFPDGAVFLFDTDLRYVRARGEELRRVGLSPDDVEGATPQDFFPDHLADELAHYFREALAGHSNTFEQELQGERYRIQTVPVETDDDEVTYGMAVSKNITEQVEQRREIEQQNERLEEFTSIVSHDLRNPLQVARTRLELLSEESDSQHVGHAMDALDRSESLVADLLMLARQGEEVEEMQTVSISTIAHKTWENIETADATLNVKTERRVEADRSYLRQLLENLFVNAIEHGGRDVTVTVGDVADGFYVEDTGPGVPDAQRDEIFEAGYSTADEGIGLGLRIVHQISESHGWDIRMTDGDASGATFEFTGVEY